MCIALPKGRHTDAAIPWWQRPWHMLADLAGMLWFVLGFFATGLRDWLRLRLVR